MVHARGRAQYHHGALRTSVRSTLCAMGQDADRRALSINVAITYATGAGTLRTECDEPEPRSFAAWWEVW